MIRPPIARPQNQWIRRHRDGHLLQATATVLGVCLLLLMLLVVASWPRLESLAVHYEISRLRQQITELEKRRHRLEVDLDTATNPTALRAAGEDLGLQLPTEAQLTTLDELGADRP